MTEADWEAIRAQPCAMCGLAYHRYCDHDPEHKWSATACINSLRAEVERLRGVVAERDQEIERMALRYGMRQLPALEEGE